VLFDLFILAQDAVALMTKTRTRTDFEKAVIASVAKQSTRDA